MAAVSSSSNGLECAICLHVYSLEACRPQVLSCGHSFCQRCAADLKNRKEPCATCKKPISSDPAPNYASLDLMEMVERVRSELNHKIEELKKQLALVSAEKTELVLSAAERAEKLSAEVEILLTENHSLAAIPLLRMILDLPNARQKAWAQLHLALALLKGKRPGDFLEEIEGLLQESKQSGLLTAAEVKVHEDLASKVREEHALKVATSLHFYRLLDLGKYREAAHLYLESPNFLKNESAEIEKFELLLTFLHQVGELDLLAKVNNKLANS